MVSLSGRLKSEASAPSRMTPRALQSPIAPQCAFPHESGSAPGASGMVDAYGNDLRANACAEVVQQHQLVPDALCEEALLNNRSGADMSQVPRSSVRTSPTPVSCPAEIFGRALKWYNSINSTSCAWRGPRSAPCPSLVRLFHQRTESSHFALRRGARQLSMAWSAPTVSRLEGS